MKLRRSLYARPEIRSEESNAPRAPLIQRRQRSSTASVEPREQPSPTSCAGVVCRLGGSLEADRAWWLGRRPARAQHRRELAEHAVGLLQPRVAATPPSPASSAAGGPPGLIGWSATSVPVTPAGPFRFHKEPPRLVRRGCILAAASWVAGRDGSPAMTAHEATSSATRPRPRVTDRTSGYALSR
jgi:hypothetical protein